MKWLMYPLYAIAGLVAIALIILLFLGGARGQARHVVSVDIARPAATVFAAVSGPDAIAAPIALLVDNQEQRGAIESETTGFEQDRLVAAHVRVPSQFTADVRYELEPKDARRTRLTYRVSIHYERWLAKLLEPVISRSAQQKLEEYIARLTQRLEGE